MNAWPGMRPGDTGRKLVKDFEKHVTVKQKGKNGKQIHKAFVARTHSSAMVHLSKQMHITGKVAVTLDGTPLSPQAGTRMGNGKVFLSGIDQRNVILRRAREFYLGMLSDMGGRDMISVVQDSILRNTAWLQCMIEEQQRQYAALHPNFDIIIYLGSVKSAVSLSKAVGLHRLAKDMGKIEKGIPTLENYLTNQGHPVSTIEDDEFDDDIFEDKTEDPVKPKRRRMKKPPRLKDYGEENEDE